MKKILFQHKFNYCIPLAWIPCWQHNWTKGNGLVIKECTSVLGNMMLNIRNDASSILIIQSISQKSKQLEGVFRINMCKPIFHPHLFLVTSKTQPLDYVCNMCSYSSWFLKQMLNIVCVVCWIVRYSNTHSFSGNMTKS